MTCIFNSSRSWACLNTYFGPKISFIKKQLLLGNGLYSVSFSSDQNAGSYCSLLFIMRYFLHEINRIYCVHTSYVVSAYNTIFNFYHEKQQKLPKKFLKICKSILYFILNSLDWPVMWDAPNFTWTEKIWRGNVR